MQPIISPLLIYLSYLSYILKCISFINILLFITIMFVIMCVNCLNFNDIKNTIMVLFKYKIFKIYLYISIITTIIAILIPDKETLLTMYVLKYITPDNLNNVKELVQEILQNI